MFAIVDAAVLTADVVLDKAALVMKSISELCVELSILVSLLRKYVTTKAMQAITIVVMSFLERKNSSIRSKFKVLIPIFGKEFQIQVDIS